MANLSNVNITITATDQTGSGVSSALSNVSRLSGGFSSIGRIASGVFGGIMGAQVFSGITRGIGNVVSSAFGLNDTMRSSALMSQSMVDAMAESESAGTSAFGGMSAAAKQYEKTIREIREKEADGLEDYAAKVDEVKQKILDAENEIASKKEERLRKEKEQLTDLADTYAEKYETINQRIEDEMLSFEERMYDLQNQKADKLERLQEQRADKEEDITDEIADLNVEMLEATTVAEEEAIQTKIALLQEELSEFLTKNDAEVAKVTERMNHEIEFAQKKHDIKIARLKDEMSEEEAEYAKRKARIEEDVKSDIAQYEAAGNKKIASLKDQLAKEKKEHERFLRDIQEAYADAQTKLSSGGSSGGAGGKRTIDFQFDWTDAFRESAGGLTSSGITEYLDEVQKKYVELGVKSPFNIGDIQKAGQSMIQFTGGSADNMETLMEITQSLAAKNPMQGMLGATTSMVELLGSGNITSISRRFDLPKSAFEGLSEAKNATEFIEMLNEKLGAVGVTYGLVEAKAMTLGGAFENVKETFNVFAAAVTKPLYDVLTNALVNVNNFLQEHQDELLAVAEVMGNFIRDGVLVLADIFQNILMPAIQGFIDGPGTMLMDLWTRIFDAFMIMLIPALELLRTIWASVQKVLEETVIPSMERIYAKIAEFWEYIAPEIQKTLEMVTQWWTENHEMIEAVLKVVWNTIEFVITTALDVLKGAIKFALAVIRGDWGEAWNAIKETFKSVWENIKTFFSNVWDSIGGIVTKGINNLIDKINGFINGLNDKLGKAKIEVGGIKVGGWQIPNIPKLAEGGIVGSATLAMIGEAGPEAVIPLNKMKGLSGGTQVLVNVTGNEIMDDGTANVLADRIGDAVAQKLGLQGQYLYT